MAYPGTPEQKAIVDNFSRMQRSATIQLWQLNATITALVNAWNANVLQIIGTPSGIPITDGNNLVGAQTLTDTQTTNLFSILQTLQSTNFTAANEVLFTMATGPENIV